MSVLLSGLRCLNLLWSSPRATDGDRSAVLTKLQPMATSAAKDLLALAREHPEEAVLCRPEYAEGFAAVTTVLLQLGDMQEAAGQVIRLLLHKLMRLWPWLIRGRVRRRQRRLRCG